MEQQNLPGDSGFQYGKYNNSYENYIAKQKRSLETKKDEDLIIDDNTIYEIDRNCFERLKKRRNK